MNISYVALALAIIVWGVEYPLMKSVTRTLGPLVTGLVIFTVATLLLGIQLWFRGGFRRNRLPARRTFWYMLMVGVIGFTLNAVSLIAISLTSVVNVATLARTDVLFSLVLAVLFFHEKVDKIAWMVTPVMLVGICLLTGVFSSTPDMGNVGDVLVLVSAFLVALNAYIIRYTVRSVEPIFTGFVNTLINSAGFMIVVLLMMPRNDVFSMLVAGFTNSYALILGVLANLFFIGYYTALKTLPVWKVRLLMLLVPVVAVVAGYIWLGETVGGTQILGMAFICAGAGSVIIVKHSDELYRNKEKKEMSLWKMIKT